MSLNKLLKFNLILNPSKFDNNKEKQMIQLIFLPNLYFTIFTFSIVL